MLIGIGTYFNYSFVFSDQNVFANVKVCELMQVLIPLCIPYNTGLDERTAKDSCQGIHFFFTMYLLFSGSSANRMAKYTTEDSVQAICEDGGQFIKMQYRE